MTQRMQPTARAHSSYTRFSLSHTARAHGLRELRVHPQRPRRAALAAPAAEGRGAVGGSVERIVLERDVEGLQRLRATLDVTGLSGKPLYTRRESKFCSEISKLSKESMDNASGARAEVARHARGGR